MSAVSPAKRDEKTGLCIDWRCSRLGSNHETGDRGKCVGYHCPHCDTPTGMMGHRCPKDPNPDGLGCVAVQGPDEAETVELTIQQQPEGMAKVDAATAELDDRVVRGDGDAGVSQRTISEVRQWVVDREDHERRNEPSNPNTPAGGMTMGALETLEDLKAWLDEDDEA